MGNRLSKIVTRTGDAGETGLATGDRIPKTSPRVDAMGEVDELNCCLGLLLVQPLPAAIREPLARIQHELFDLGGELSMPGAVLVTESYLARLEATVDALNAGLPPLKDFVLPGGNPSAAAAHLARAVARRAERAVWSLAATEQVSPLVPQYLNRLSDLLFVCCRVLAREDGGSEVTWKKQVD
jgi:cob(I)alamin adenosyltransferase